MPQFRQYPQVTTLEPTDAFILDREDEGSVYIEGDDFLAASLDTIADLPAATLPLTGNEPLPVIQDGHAVQTTPNDILDLIIGQAVDVDGADWYNFDHVSIGSGQATNPLRVENAAGSAVGGVLIEQYATAAGAYGLESHVYPGAHGHVFHHYSDEDTCLKIDNVGNQSIITLNNTENGAVRPGVEGDGVFITFGGYDSSNVHGILAILGPTLQFANYDPAMQFNFTSGLICAAGVSETNRALTVTGLNAGYAATFNGTDSGILISTTTNSGQALAIAKTGTGAGVVILVDNRGSGNTVEYANAGGTVHIVDKDGHVGIGLAPSTTGLAVKLANSTQAYFASTGANNANVRVDSNTAGNEANILFQDATTTKFTIGKSTANGFRVNLTGVGDIVSINATGDLTLSYSGGKLAFFGGTPVVKPSVSGVLSAVTDANAKAVLTSIIAALKASGLNLVTDATT